MKGYRIIIEKTSKYFPIIFKYKENAEIFCVYLSKRDNTEKYRVIEVYWEFSIPEFQDEEMLKQLNDNMARWWRW